MSAASFENRIWNESETLLRAALGNLHLERLRRVVELSAAVPFYRQAFDRAAVELVPPQTLERFVGKARRVTDNR